MADGIDDDEERPETLVIEGQTAGIYAYLKWKGGNWPDRQGGTRKKDFLDGYGAGVRAVMRTFPDLVGQIEGEIHRGRL